MILFTSLFKSNVTRAIFAICAIEALVFFFFRPVVDQKNNFYGMNFSKDTNRAKFIIYEKINELKNHTINSFQVGGSSGLHAINPTLIDSSYFNLSCCRNTGFDGYRYIAEYALEKTKARNLILYLSPYSFPWLPDGNLFNSAISESFENFYLGYRRYLWLPSLSLRGQITNLLYRFKIDADVIVDDTMTLVAVSNNQVRKILKENRGWFPFKHNVNKSRGQCEVKYFLHIDEAINELEKFRLLSEKYDATFFLVFNPVPCDRSAASDFFESKIKSYAAKHRNVYVPFDLITTWPEDRFGDDIHLNEIGAKYATERINNMFKK